MAKSIDEKWLEVKAYYERAYRPSFKEPFRFEQRLTDDVIEKLYVKMEQLKKELSEYYAFATFLEKRSKNVQETPKLILKRLPHE